MFCTAQEHTARTASHGQGTQHNVPRQVVQPLTLHNCLKCPIFHAKFLSYARGTPKAPLVPVALAALDREVWGAAGELMDVHTSPPTGGLQHHVVAKTVHRLCIQAHRQCRQTVNTTNNRVCPRLCTVQHTRGLLAVCAVTAYPSFLGSSKVVLRVL